ncbi:hypothetical protein CMV_028796 [Castanea mollissima]|uniref:Uncharacterized protein n=1 Tax=Castanea mollissima TaxID=60419 RepID=A0A8J4QFL3_9ROSI|nr:hypothetical protein CMV_028796 [Castanea mollissima]
MKFCLLGGFSFLIDFSLTFLGKFSQRSILLSFGRFYIFGSQPVLLARQVIFARWFFLKNRKESKFTEI